MARVDAPGGEAHEFLATMDVLAHSPICMNLDAMLSELKWLEYDLNDISPKASNYERLKMRKLTIEKMIEDERKKYVVPAPAKTNRRKSK